MMPKGTMILVSGSAGRANLKFALERYERLFHIKFGKVAGEVLVRSTSHLEPVPRLWELERLYTGKERLARGG